MIIPVKKYIFIGVNEDLEVFFERAQKKGFVEFINPTGKRGKELPDQQQKLVKAIKILGKMPKVKQAGLVKDLQPLKLANTVVQNKEWLERLYEEERMMKSEIARIMPLGDFSIDELRAIEQEGNKRVQFFCVKRSKAKKMTVPDELIYLNTEYDMDYYMSVSSCVESFPGMIEMHIDKSLSTLEKELSHVQDSIQNCEKELKEDCAYLDFLKEHLVHQLNRVPALPIQLVDEGHDGRGAHAAHLHQLDGALLDALRPVDHHQRGVHRGQRAVGVLGEVFVARGVEQVDDALLVGELHHRGGDRNPALLLHLHPVRGGVAGRFAPLHRAGKLDGTAEQQELFGQRGFTRIRVRNDRKSAPFGGLFGNAGHGTSAQKPRIVASSLRTKIS